MDAFDSASPLAFLFAGFAGLVYWAGLGFYLKRRPRTYLTATIAEIHGRFERGAKLSWALLIFGGLWMLQVRYLG